MAEHIQLGRKGEKAALRLLRQKGYRILHTNWRWQKAEIDIIARKENTIVFVEVKTRRTDLYGEPEEQITGRKQALLAEAADHYMQSHQLDGEVRFDIISVIINSRQSQLRHIEDAFYPFGND
jgi:putative endonuclease